MQHKTVEATVRGSTSGGRAFNPSIHGARGLFASLVFCFHVENSGLPTFYRGDHWLATWVFQSGKFGVELFFGISGFVILGALERAPSIRAFLWDRATRIYPLLWVTLLVITAASLVSGHWLPPFGDWALNFLAPPPVRDLPQVNPAAWSLGYEIGFYLICACAWEAERRRVSGLSPVLIVTGLALVCLLPRAALMPVGVLIAAGRLDGRFVARASAWPGLWLGAYLVVRRLADLEAPGGDITTLTPTQASLAAWLAGLPLLLLGAACGGFALRGIAAGKGWLSWVLRGRILQWLGTISFSFYLWQPVTMGITKSVFSASGGAAASSVGAQAIFAMAALPTTLLLAAFSQRWIEKWLTQRLRRLGPREDAGTAPTTAGADVAAGAFPYDETLGRTPS